MNPASAHCKRKKKQNTKAPRPFISVLRVGVRPSRSDHVWWLVLFLFSHVVLFVVSVRKRAVRRRPRRARQLRRVAHVWAVRRRKRQSRVLRQRVEQHRVLCGRRGQYGVLSDGQQYLRRVRAWHRFRRVLRVCGPFAGVLYTRGIHHWVLCGHIHTLRGRVLLRVVFSQHPRGGPRTVLSADPSSVHNGLEHDGRTLGVCRSLGARRGRGGRRGPGVRRAHAVVVRSRSVCAK